MTEQTFEEQFPSLKGKGTDDVETDCMNELIFHFTVIQKHCLDKQKVRDVIIELRFDESGKGDYILDANRLLKELGLGDEKCH